MWKEGKFSAAAKTEKKISDREAGGRAKPGLVMGHHQVEGGGEVDTLLHVCDFGYFQPLLRGMDSGLLGIGQVGGEADWRDLFEAMH